MTNGVTNRFHGWTTDVGSRPALKPAVRTGAMKVAAAVCAVLAGMYGGVPALGQVSSNPMIEAAPETPAGEILTMMASEVTTWENEEPSSPTGTASVVQLGSVQAGAVGKMVSLQIDRTRLKAKSAVIWINNAPGAVGDKQLVRIALLGDAVVEQDGIRRSGPTLYVTAVIRGSIQINVAKDGVAEGTRQTRNIATGETYVLADNLRKVAEEPTALLGSASVARAAGEPRARRGIRSENARRLPVQFTAGYSPTIEGPDGKMAVLLSGGATIFSRLADGTFVELRAERAVLFTSVTSLLEMDKVRSGGNAEDLFTGAYLEGDVRVTYSPGGQSSFGEARMEGERVYYDLVTNRAMVTDAVLHSFEATKAIPIILRAKTVELVAKGQYKAQGVEVSTSSFATPTYSLRATKMYVREVPPTNESEKGTTNFSGENVNFKVLGLPFFYLPYAGGNTNAFPLRTIAYEDSDKFGVGIRTEWGLFESLGQPAPEGVDASYRLDYLDGRGFATGFDSKYQGGLVTETTAEPWNYQGEFTSYYINDHGLDRLGGYRLDTYAGQRRRGLISDPTKPSGFRRDNTGDRQWNRGNFLWEHQHFLPEDWQVQLRAGYASDPTFLEQFFQREFNRDLPYELSFYAKRQIDTEQLYILATTPLNDFPTSADEVQEQAQVQRFPEIGYNRIGESILDDNFTLFSNNTGSLLAFKTPDESYMNALLDQGYQVTDDPGRSSYGPGLKSYAQTGRSGETVGRADLRQELDYPTELGQFKVVPYVVGRYTGYTESPGTARTVFDSATGFPKTNVTGSTGAQNRVYAAAGARLTTAFWRIDDTVQSEMFDIHRVRHIVEPGANAFVSASTADRTEVYIYDEEIDGIHDINAAQLQLLQRWQTKRGGPGRWRNVDFVTLNMEANFFAQKPHELEQRNRDVSYRDDGGDESLYDVRNFRGLFFNSLPESSIPRDSFNADASWRVSDTTLLVADQQYNIEENNLATAAVGIGVSRDPRLTYTLEQRYIEPLNSNITSFGTKYVVSSKYTIYVNVSYDFAYLNNVSQGLAVERQFDRVKAIVSVYTDSINDDTGFRFIVIPDGLSARGPGRFFSSLESRTASDNR